MIKGQIVRVSGTGVTPFDGTITASGEYLIVVEWAGTFITLRRDPALNSWCFQKRSVTITPVAPVDPLVAFRVLLHNLAEATK